MEREPGLFEVMYSMRAMRRLKPDPVPDALILEILRAGTAAPSGGNFQDWRFLVVRDPEVKRKVQAFYQRAFDESVSPLYAHADPPPGVTREQYDRQHEAVRHLTEHFHEAPVWIVACRGSRGPEAAQRVPGRGDGASIYPAVQNMLLAARALGLGATLTTRHLMFGGEVDAILGLPPGAASYAILPIGWPAGRFGPTRRASLAEVVFADTWGQPWTPARAADMAEAADG